MVLKSFKFYKGATCELASSAGTFNSHSRSPAKVLQRATELEFATTVAFVAKATLLQSLWPRASALMCGVQGGTAKKRGWWQCSGGWANRGWSHCLCHLTATKALGLSPATWSKNCVSQVALGAVKQRCRRHKCCFSNAGFHILLLLWSSCNWSGNQQLTKKRCKKNGQRLPFFIGGTGECILAQTISQQFKF